MFRKSICPRLLHFLQFLFLFHIVNACGYWPVVNETITPVQVVPRGSIRRSSGAWVPTWRPIQIETRMEDATIKAKNVFNDRDLKDIAKFTIRAVRKFKKYVQVREVDGMKFNISGNDCPAANVNLKGNDYFLWVRADDNCPDSTLATASSCSFPEKMVVDKTTLKVYYENSPPYEDLRKHYNNDTEWHMNTQPWLGRPLAGQLKICTKSFKNRVLRADDDKWVSTFLHEMGHALGIAPHHFRNYHNGSNLYDKEQLSFTQPDKQGCTGDDCMYEIPGVVKKVKREWRNLGGTGQRDVYMMVTDKAKTVAKRFFSCDDIEGIELENNGGPGSAFAHVEKRVFEHETMTATRTQENKWSEITLAIMESSGWYKVNYSAADPMEYGRGKGCDFAKKSCLDFVDNGPDKGYPFCQSSDEARCSADRTSIEKCNRATYAKKDVPALYQYWKPKDEDKERIPMDFADYCPYYTTYSSDNKDTKCTIPDSQILFNGSSANKESDTARQERKGKLQIFSKSARCFEVGGENKMEEVKRESDGSEKKSTIKLRMKFGCFEHKCEKGSLWIKTARSKFYRCWHTKQEIHVHKRLTDEKWTSKFTIICPPCSELCPNDFTCKEDRQNVPKRVGDPERSSSKENLVFLFIFTLLSLV